MQQSLFNKILFNQGLFNGSYSPPAPVNRGNFVLLLGFKTSNYILKRINKLTIKLGWNRSNYIIGGDL